MRKMMIPAMVVAMIITCAALVSARQGPPVERSDEIAELDNPQAPGGEPSEEKREEVRKKIEAVRIWRLTEALKLDAPTSSKLSALLSSFDQQRDVHVFCKLHGIRLEGYSPLTRGAKLGQRTIRALAQAHGRTPAQIMLRWALQKEVVTIPKSVHKERILENAAIFGRPGVVLAMRLIEGLFPDYKQVIPKQGSTFVKVGREALLATLRRVTLLSSDKAHAVKLELGKGQLRVLSQNPDLGAAKEDVPVEYEGEPLKIGFNARYLIEVLAVPQSADVVLELADDLSPGVLKGAEEKDQGFTAVVMPMRI